MRQEQAYELCLPTALTRANRCFVLVGKLFVDILVHEGSFAYAGVTQNDDLQKGFPPRHGYVEKRGEEKEEEAETVFFGNLSQLVLRAESPLKKTKI